MIKNYNKISIITLKLFYNLLRQIYKIIIILNLTVKIKFLKAFIFSFLIIVQRYVYIILNQFYKNWLIHIIIAFLN